MIVRIPLLLLSLLLAAPAAAAPMGVSVGGLERGAFRFELTYDYGYRTVAVAVDRAPTADDDALPDRAGISTGSATLALELEPVRHVALQVRGLLQQPQVPAAGYKGPFGWGLGATLRITPLHAAGDAFHLGAYGALDGQFVGLPTDADAPLTLWSLRAGVGVGAGGEAHGYYADLGVHYARSWGRLTPAGEDGPRYALALPLPLGVHLGAGLISGPLAPAHNQRSRVHAGVDVRLIDEWAVTFRVGAVL